MTIVEQFAADYFVRERLSPDRRTFVLSALARFAAHGGAPVEQLTDTHLRAFLNALAGKGLHPNTVRKYNHAIKPFYRWAWETRVLGADHYLRIKGVPNPRGATGNATPRPYKRPEIARLWRQIETTYPMITADQQRRFVAGRTKYAGGKVPVWRHATRLQIEAIVGLALFAGLRHAEITNLEIPDFHPDNEFIVVRGKTVVHDTPKVREVPYTQEGRELVWRWLEFRDVLGPTHELPWLVLNPAATPNSPLMPSHPLNPISSKGFDDLLSRVGPGWEYHRLRHTCATEWLRQGMKLEKLQKLLGHATIGQTLCYAQLLNDDVARDVQLHETAFMGALSRKAA